MKWILSLTARASLVAAKAVEVAAANAAATTKRAAAATAAMAVTVTVTVTSVMPLSPSHLNYSASTRMLGLALTA